MREMHGSKDNGLFWQDDNVYIQRFHYVQGIWALIPYRENKIEFYLIVQYVYKRCMYSVQENNRTLSYLLNYL